MNKKARMIAFYLPQFHPIPENDLWWGKGFTEWTNVAKAKPLYRGHYQPNVPADLGFYDLRLPESRNTQADLARSYGLEGFCYWHYWFAGKELLERPFKEVLASGEPDFPFCLAWANQTWTGIWHGMSNKILIEQTYPGKADYQEHFESLLPAFTDPRYITVDKKPLFLIYCPYDIPQVEDFIEYWRELADRAGLNGLYFVGRSSPKWKPEEHGFDGSFCGSIYPESFNSTFAAKVINKLWYENIRKRLLKKPRVFKYIDIIEHAYDMEERRFNRYPVVVPNWDNTPRSGKNGVVFAESTPKLFAKHLKDAVNIVNDRDYEHKIIFLKSWNEWAEGNYVEPDLRFGARYLEAIKK